MAFSGSAHKPGPVRSQYRSTWSIKTTISRLRRLEIVHLFDAVLNLPALPPAQTILTDLRELDIE
jgi:hypothetical protein